MSVRTRPNVRFENVRGLLTSSKVHDAIGTQAQDAHELQTAMVNTVTHEVVVGGSGSLGAVVVSLIGHLFFG
jgi:hypothetical protein